MQKELSMPTKSEKKFTESPIEAFCFKTSIGSLGATIPVVLALYFLSPDARALAMDILAGLLLIGLSTGTAYMKIALRKANKAG
tara:strand:- start:135 stop:386 length:252 start_codon:yes stop_codon:yes gene_type:complete